MHASTHAEVSNVRFTTSEAVLNGSHIADASFVGHPVTATKLLKMENYDPSMMPDVDEDDSDSDHTDMMDGMATLSQNTHLITNTVPKPGKKTKGRVKIKMEFIENKLRRYTTFSKRKTGIMKKAYELSTLTGTQVMLLVASETGHVYTFATRKLQPMITSESGKALIQTCLNSPDNGQGGPAAQVMEQRMNPTGFEETELSYAVGEEENKVQSIENAVKNVLAYSIPTAAGEATTVQTTSTNSSIPTMQIPSATQALPTVTYIPTATNAAQAHMQPPTQMHQTVSTSSKTNIPVQIPGVPPGGITAIIQSGTPITIPIQGNHANQTSAQTLYRLPGPNHQIVSLANLNSNSSSPGEGNPQATATGTLSNITASSSSIGLLAGSSQQGTAVTPGVVMYQTPQGIVYAPTTAMLQERPIFNFQQQSTALSVHQSEQGQQVITIPVPVSLAGGAQMLQFATPTTMATTESLVTDLSQPPASKKSRK